MSRYDLGGIPPKNNCLYYLDTSAVYPLALEQAVKLKESPWPSGSRIEQERAKKLRQFIIRGNSQGALFRTSILSVEECAAKARNKTRTGFAQRQQYVSWQAMKSSNPSAFADVDKAAHEHMLKFIKWIILALSGLKIRLMRTAVKAEDALSDADRLQNTIHTLLKNYPQIDAMDALHVAVGVECGAKDFISFDDAWGTINEIDVHS